MITRLSGTTVSSEFKCYGVHPGKATSLIWIICQGNKQSISRHDSSLCSENWIFMLQRGSCCSTDILICRVNSLEMAIMWVEVIILLRRELTDSQVLGKSSICFKEERNKINKPPDNHLIATNITLYILLSVIIPNRWWLVFFHHSFSVCSR